MYPSKCNWASFLVYPIYNLSCEQSNDDLMFITSLRIVWNSTNTSDFNICIPYIQVRDVTKRELQYGPALVIETVPMNGGYVMGFTLATPMELDRVANTYCNLKMKSVHGAKCIEI
eukprot:g7689.t1